MIKNDLKLKNAEKEKSASRIGIKLAFCKRILYIYKKLSERMRLID